MLALLIPVEGPLQEVELDDTLEQLQEIVGGNIQDVPVPSFLPSAEEATAYVNEDGKYLESCEPNMRATDFMVPGVGIFYGDYIAGPMLLCGFNPGTGEHVQLPKDIIERARLIEREAA